MFSENLRGVKILWLRLYTHRYQTYSQSNIIQDEH